MSGLQKQQIPYISYQLSLPSKQGICFRINGNEIHKVANADDFYKALGYTDEHRRLGNMPDEYIWQTYTAANRTKTEADLQAGIIEYLTRCSPEFIRQYGEQYESWLDTLLARETK